MATKNTKSAGKVLGQSKEYWIAASKQFIWPIDFIELHISVPHKDLHLAQDNLMIQHFKAHGWHIQSAIVVEYTKPFIAPVSDKPMFTVPKVVEEKEAEFRFNQKFQIKSTGCELRISSIDKKSITLEYTNRVKPEIVTNPDNLAKSIRMGAWLKI